MNWDFIVLVGTLLFFAAIHQWPPDGRRWQRDDPKPADDDGPSSGASAVGQGQTEFHPD